MTKHETVRPDDDVVERLEYAEACDRANRLRDHAETALGRVVNEEAASGSQMMVYAVEALVLAVLEVGARLELLELDAELAREETPE